MATHSVFLPGKCHGQSNLVGCDPWGRRVRPNWAHVHSAYNQANMRLLSARLCSLGFFYVIPFLWSDCIHTQTHTHTHTHTHSVLPCNPASVFVVSCLVLSDSVTQWAVACQAPLFMRFPRQEYWSQLPFPSPGDLLDVGIKPMSPASLLHCRWILYHWASYFCL